MKKRPLGQTGIMVSPLGLGTVKFGRNIGVKYPTSFELPSDKELSHLIEMALALGINVIDTAPAYGTSEQRLGSLLKHCRHQFCLITKVGEEFQRGSSTFDFSQEHINYSIKRSLQRLQTDYIDVVLIHSDGNDLNIINHSDAIPTLRQLQSEGIIKAIGMSTKTVPGGIEAVKLMDLVMVTYNLHATEEIVVIDFAEQLKKGVLVKKALASGHLGGTNKESKGDNKLQRSLQHVLSHTGVSSAIVGSINPGHLRTNSKVANSLML